MIASQVVVNEETATATAEFISKRLQAIKSQRSAGDLEELALVIGALVFSDFRNPILVF